MAEQYGQSRKKDRKDINRLLYYLGFFYISKIIYIELISWHHNDLLVGYLGVEKLPKLVARKYYWEMMHHKV